MAEIKIDVQGLRNKFRAYGQAVTQEAVPVALERGALVVEREAKRRAPVDDGHLRRSITHRIVDQEGELVAQVGTNLHYAIHVEFGHRTRLGKGYKSSALYRYAKGKGKRPTIAYVPGRFFLKGALEAKRKVVTGIITKHVQQAGEEIKR